MGFIGMYKVAYDNGTRLSVMWSAFSGSTVFFLKYIPECFVPRISLLTDSGIPCVCASLTVFTDCLRIADAFVIVRNCAYMILCRCVCKGLKICITFSCNPRILFLLLFCSLS